MEGVGNRYKERGTKDREGQAKRWGRAEEQGNEWDVLWKMIVKIWRERAREREREIIGKLELHD